MLNSSPFPRDFSPDPSCNWVALSIGNTHWKWGYFEGGQLTQVWKTTAQLISPSNGWADWCERSPAFAWHHQQGKPPFPLLRLASVVQQEQALWLHYPNLQSITLPDVLVPNLYPSLGIDRALAILGAGQQYGWPVLVIDAGTALTFSGADQTGFQGGAIAPGIGLQLSMLHDQTEALPQLSISAQLPPRWATDTDTAIQSGVLWSVLSSIQDFCENWIRNYPQSSVIFTGGDGAILLELFQQHHKQSLYRLSMSHFDYNEHLIFNGMAHCQIQP